MDFRPDHQDKTFCCPRTWEFTNRLIANQPELDDEQAILLAGTITSGVAADFVQFTKIFQELVTVKDILQNPKTCPIPPAVGGKWAVITHMMSHITEKNLAGLGEYADRFSVDFRILFYRCILVRKPELRVHPAFINAMSALSRYLHN